MNKLKQEEPAANFKRADWLYILLWLGISGLTWSFMHSADHFLELTPEALGKYFDLKWVLIAHITAGGGALVIGPVQFWEKLRKGNRKLHRVTGLLYLLAILTSGMCAVILAFTTAYTVNWSYAFSLQVWVTVWFIATFIAYRAALQKKFRLHKEWMVRSYVITLAFIISGLLLKTTYVQQLGSFAEISPSFFWMGWSVPLFLYEIVLSVKRNN
jgi:hypothetical protein